MNNDAIAITGIVGQDPKHLITNDGLEIASMRVASNARRYDRTQQKWVDGETNWYTVTAFRQLAGNVKASVHKGERVVVHGRLRIRNWTNGERSGVQAEIEAHAIGHDLSWGTTVLSRGSADSARTVRAEPDAGAVADTFAATVDSSDGWPSVGGSGAVVTDSGADAATPATDLVLDDVHPLAG